MEYRPLNITLISAEGLKDVNLFSKMDVYTEVSIEGYPASMKKTAVDKDCGTHPKWNHRMEFIVDEPYLTKPGLSLIFQIKSESTIGSDKEIGSVVIAIDDLYKGNSSAAEEKTDEYQVRTPSGKAKGSLKISYKFGEKFTPEQQKQPEVKKNVHESVTAYPTQQPYAPGSSDGVPPPHPGMGYPAPPTVDAYQGYPPQVPYGYQAPPPGPYGYHAPPQGPYGYQAPPPGYGYPPAAGYGAYPPEQKPKKNKMGMGGAVGLGLGAGLLGGLLVGEAASEIGDAAAYADGYGDAGGFDF